MSRSSVSTVRRPCYGGLAATRVRDRATWFLATLALAAGCAVPVPPAGGPPDTRPPALVESVPADGEVDVATDRIVLRFDEYVDERSVAAAVTITPSPSRAPAIRYDGREVELRFDSALRDSTTFILTIDSGFRDAHGVALDSPIRIAFSTGAHIDRGRLAGRVVEWDRGAPAAGIDVFAYDADADLSVTETEPAYRTQTDREGSFSFGYLPSRRFMVLAVRDDNRNRRIDAGEWSAAGPEASFQADSAAVEIVEPWVLSPRDREAPEVRRVEAVSDSRILVRFSEPVLPTHVSGEGFSVADSTGSLRVPVLSAYRGAADDRSIYVVTGPMPAGSLRLSMNLAVRDSVGNPAPASTRDFVVSTVADTLVARMRGISADSLTVDGRARLSGALVLAPWSSPTIEFDSSPGGDLLESALVVTDTASVRLPFDLDSEDGLRWRVRPRDFGGTWVLSWSEGEGVRFDSVRTRRYALAPASALGELSGTTASPDSTWLVTLVPAAGDSEPERTAAPDRTGAFVFRGLPGGGRYRFRVFADLDRDGRWSPGSIAPWRRAEPLGWGAEAPAVRSRWETVMPDTLRLGLPPRVRPSETPVDDEPDP